MEELNTFRVRLKVRVTKPLDSLDDSTLIEFRGRDLKISAYPNGPFNKARWIVFNAFGFTSETDARQYGEILRDSVEILGVASRFGIDIGSSKESNWINAEAAWEAGLVPREHIPKPNVHGLSIHVDDPRIRFFNIDIKVELHASAKMFLETLQDMSALYRPPTPKATNSLRLMNQALLSPDPLAQIALAFSAVEALSQEDSWSVSQRAALKSLSLEVDRFINPGPEQDELVEALNRSMHRLSVRQSIKRLLRQLDLSDLERDWDHLYSVRSSLFHGSENLDNARLTESAVQGITLCGRVVLRFAEAEGVVLPPLAKTQYDPENQPKVITGFTAAAAR